MKLKEFYYNLPKELIAVEPMKPRDHSRLLLLDKKSGHIEHRHFYDIVDYLKKGDVLVMNNSKVFPARLIGSKKLTGGKAEVFLLKNNNQGVWQCLTHGLKGKDNQEVVFKDGLSGRIIKNNNDGTWLVQFNKRGKSLLDSIEKVGQVPLPPYIKRLDKTTRQQDKKNYQTVYADDSKLGSVAAPTAGFHFTKSLLNKLKKKGVQIEYVTLHVGLGTFAPVKVEDITKHKMHDEWVEADKATIARLYLTKHQNRRIIAVGTTSARSLEAIAAKFPISNFPAYAKASAGRQFPNNFQFSISKYIAQFKDFQESVNIFIFPGYKFKIIDGMITNFHLSKSTLLMLVSALAGKKNIDKAYEVAINKRYRFYSYGDSMFIY
jgi:S-adenosylmethionine:tRNA ribosyltransferase-isomerase